MKNERLSELILFQPSFQFNRLPYALQKQVIWLEKLYSDLKEVFQKAMELIEIIFC